MQTRNLITILTLILYATISFAANLDPTHQTQINEIDPLFEENIKDYKGLESAVDEQVTKSVQGIEKQQGFNDLPNSEQAQDEASRLSAIGANELDSEGRAAQNKEAWIDDVFIDYTKPGAKKTKEDMKEIASSTDKLMLNLLGKLKELGIVDCETVKGDIEVEPQYYIDLETKPVQDRIYDQFFCEELRNRYSCADTMTLTCKTQGMQYGEWQNKEIHVAGGELINAGKDVFYVDHVAKNCFEFKLFLQGKTWWCCDPYYPPAHAIQGMREFLATKHENATIDNIGMEMSSDFNGGISSIDGWTHCGRRLGSKDYMWNNYIIRYKYREGKLACFEWSEEWNEACHLQ